MTNTIISLVLTLAIAATLGGQIASTVYRASSVRATLTGERTAPHVSHVLNGKVEHSAAS
jgi:hypothetical protein